MYSTFMSWKTFDMKNEWSRPQPGQLVALRMVSKSWSPRVSYQVGMLKIPDYSKPRARKLYWHGQGIHTVSDPLKMQKEYDIWWCPLPPFKADGSY